MAQVNPQVAFATATVCAQVKPTILIAEDSNDGREMMEMLLRLKGYRVLSAENGAEALEVALRHHPDMVLLDFCLPKLDGLGVTRNLRSHPEFRNTPIIIVSGQDPVPYRQSALDAGCTDYLLKPIDFERLDQILELNVSLAS